MGNEIYLFFFLFNLICMGFFPYKQICVCLFGKKKISMNWIFEIHWGKIKILFLNLQYVEKNIIHNVSQKTPVYTDGGTYWLTHCTGHYLKLRIKTHCLIRIGLRKSFEIACWIYAFCCDSMRFHAFMRLFNY